MQSLRGLAFHFLHNRAFPIPSRCASTLGPSPSTDAVLRRYQELLNCSILRPDPLQLSVLKKLNSLFNELLQYEGGLQEYHRQEETYQAARKQLMEQLQCQQQEQQRQEQEVGRQPQWKLQDAFSFGGWLGTRSNPPGRPPASQPPDLDQLVAQRLGPRPQPPRAPQGMYIWGSVGSGKSMLMDLFFGEAQRLQVVPHMLRIHFNSAMIQIHSHLHQLDKQRKAQEATALHVYQQALRAAQEQEGAALPAKNWALLRLDPAFQRLKRARLARLAVRRFQREKLSRSPQENDNRLAQSNSASLAQAGQLLLKGRKAGSEGSEAGLSAGLLCLDEMQVGDAFNAVALKGVLEPLLASGCVLVCTSNKAPQELNSYGLHEELFSHFVTALMQHCTLVSLSAGHDYRRAMAEEAQGAGNSERLGGHYITPVGEGSVAAMDEWWEALVAAERAADARLSMEEGAISIPVAFGRQLQMPRVVGGVARCSFEWLCARCLGGTDYQALAARCHTLMLEGVPQMSLRNKDQARRFIVLVDELYNQRCQLVVSAACTRDLLFAGNQEGTAEDMLLDLESLQFESAVEGSRLRRDVMADGGVAPVADRPAALRALTAGLGGGEEQFAFAWAVSRLYEMTTPVYLQSRNRPRLDRGGGRLSAPSP